MHTLKDPENAPTQVIRFDEVYAQFRLSVSTVAKKTSRLHLGMVTRTNDGTELPSVEDQQKLADGMQVLSETVVAAVNVFMKDVLPQVNATQFYNPAQTAEKYMDGVLEKSAGEFVCGLTHTVLRDIIKDKGAEHAKKVYKATLWCNGHYAAEEMPATPDAAYEAFERHEADRKAKDDGPKFCPVVSDPPPDNYGKIGSTWNFLATAAIGGNHTAINRAFMVFFRDNVSSTMTLIEAIHALWRECSVKLKEFADNNASINLEAEDPLDRVTSLARMVNAGYRPRKWKDGKLKSVALNDLTQRSSSATNATVAMAVAVPTKTAGVAVGSNTGADGARCDQSSDMEGMDAAQGSGKGPQQSDQAAFGSPWTDNGHVEMGGVNAAEVLGTMVLDGGAVDAAEGPGTTDPGDGAAQGGRPSKRRRRCTTSDP